MFINKDQQKKGSNWPRPKLFTRIEVAVTCSFFIFFLTWMSCLNILFRKETMWSFKISIQITKYMDVVCGISVWDFGYHKSCKCVPKRCGLKVEGSFGISELYVYKNGHSIHHMLMYFHRTWTQWSLGDLNRGGVKGHLLDHWPFWFKFLKNVHIFWCISMGLGHSDYWVIELHMWPMTLTYRSGVKRHVGSFTFWLKLRNKLSLHCIHILVIQMTHVTVTFGVKGQLGSFGVKVTFWWNWFIYKSNGTWL